MYHIVNYLDGSLSRRINPVHFLANSSFRDLAINNLTCRWSPPGYTTYTLRLEVRCEVE